MHAYQLKSIALMLDKSEKAVECSTRGYLSKARELIDELRFLRAVFMKTLDAKQDMHVIDIGEGQYPQNLASCTSSDLMGPFDPISKRHFSASCFSSLAC